GFPGGPPRPPPRDRPRETLREKTLPPLDRRSGRPPSLEPASRLSDETPGFPGPADGEARLLPGRASARRRAFRPENRLHRPGRPEAGDRKADGRDRGRAARPGAPGRHRLRKDVHDGEGD